MTAATTAPALDPLALLGGLVLEDGRPWAQAAYPWQTDDARAVLTAHTAAADSTDDTEPAPRRHYWLRGRGMSKSSDAAAVALALLLTEAPARSRSYVYAVDTDQAALFADALAGFVARTPGLAAVLDVGARTVSVRSTGASLSVESSDGSSALGTRPWLIVADELAAWPQSANHRRLWAAITSALPKVPGSRLIVTTTAGSPVGTGAEVWAQAETSPHWRTARRPGPSPWWTPDDIAAAQADLTESEYLRLIRCEFAEGDDTLTTPDDVEAVIRPGSTVLPPSKHTRYVAALDVGTRRDLTALVVGHSEQRDGGRVTVIDRVLYWRPTKTERVDLSEVEAATLALCAEYDVAHLRFDRMQAEQLTTNLAAAGVRTDEYVFSQSGANRLARGLHLALRDRTLSLPDDPEVRAEFITTRLVETGPGTVKLQNPRGAHDDIVTAVGMVVADLTDRPQTVGSARVTLPTGKVQRAPLALTKADYRRDPRVRRTALRRAAAAQPRGLRGIIGIGRNSREGDR